MDILYSSNSINSVRAGGCLIVANTNSAVILATSELCRTGLVPFLKANISRITGTWQIPVSLLILAFKNGTKPVRHGSEVASVNTL